MPKGGNGKNVHVVPHEDGWATRTEGASRAGKVHRTQDQAWDAARGTAKDRGAEAFLHGRDGRIRERNSFGSDPYPPPG